MHFRQAGFSLRARWNFSAGLAFFIALLIAAQPTRAGWFGAPTPPGKTATAPAPKPAPTPAAPARGVPPKKRAPEPKPPTAAPPPGDAAESAPPKAAPAKSAPASPPSSAHGAPEFADAWPSEFRPSAADLQLKADDARKADAFRFFAEGLVAEDNSDQDAMLESYRHALELDPSYSELAVKVAYELARRNDVAAGIQILKDAIKATPKEPLPYIYLSQLYSQYLKKPDLGLTYAEQALALAPDNFKSYLAVYELHDSAGQKAKAEAVLARAVKVESKDVRYWTDLGDFLQKIYLKDDGTCSAEELKRMNVVYQRLADLGKDDPVILSKIADYFVLSKQVKQAIPRYLEVLRMRPASDDGALGNVREKLARSLILTGQRDEAIAVIEEIVKENPQRFDTYELLGELYGQKGDLDRAMQNYEHSLLLDSSEPRNHLRLADLLREAKKFDKAVEILQQAQKKFPDLPFITYGLALALSQAKRHEEALAAFAQTQSSAESRNEELLNASFFFSYGAAAEQAGKLERAAELLKQSIDLDPNAAQAYNYLGYMWADRSEHLDEAGNLIKKALELDPDNGAYLDSLGWYYYKRGEPEKALKELLRAQENILREDKRDDAVVLDHIADTYSKLGKIPEALSFWQKAITLETDDKSLAGKITEKIEAAKQKVTSGGPTPEPAKQ
jgi:tetratricopeptide (TPR) repeat protein